MYAIGLVRQKLSALLAAKWQSSVEDPSTGIDTDDVDTVFVPPGFETVPVEDAPAGRALRALPLPTPNHCGPRYLGVVALWEGHAPLRPLDFCLLQEVAKHLHAANDVHTVS